MNYFLSARSKIIIYLFCLGVIIGPAYTTYDHFDFSHSPDTKSYLKMAQGNFDVTITHRYRIIVPFMAAAINAPVAGLYKVLWPDREPGAPALMMCFFIVNSLITALAGLFIVQIGLHYGASIYAALIATLAFLCSSWTAYIAGLPLIDSLYILTIALAVYGIKSQSRLALIFSILIGPFAKESYIFIAPLILLFGRDTLHLKFQIPLFILSGVSVFLLRYYIDHMTNTPIDANLSNAINHSENIMYTIKRVFSARGIGEILRVWGVFTLVLFIGFIGGKSGRGTWLPTMDWLAAGLLLSVLLHMLLSGDAGRMLFLASPVFVAAIALILDRHPFFESLRVQFKNLSLKK